MNIKAYKDPRPASQVNVAGPCRDAEESQMTTLKNRMLSVAARADVIATALEERVMELQIALHGPQPCGPASPRQEDSGDALFPRLDEINNHLSRISESIERLAKEV